MGLRLNELAPAPGAKKPNIAAVVVSAQAWVKQADVVSRDKPHAQVLASAQVLKAVKCLCTVVCQNLVLPVNWQW